MQNVVVNETTGRLIDGHLRVALAQRRGEQVPVTYVSLTEEEEIIVLSVLDPIVGLAELNAEKLGDLLDAVQTDNALLTNFLSDLRAAESILEGREPDEVSLPEVNLGVLVVCETEQEQERVFSQLRSEGLNVKLIRI